MMSGVQNKRKYRRSTSLETISTQCTVDANDVSGQKNKEKKRRNSYSFEDKDKMLKALENQPLLSVSQEYHVNEKLLLKWKKSRKEIQAAAQDGSLRDKKKKRSSMEDVDQAVHDWFINARTAGIPLNGPLVRQKALKLNEEMGGNPNFQASPGWFTRWKLRHKVRYLRIAGEKQSADFAAAENYREDFVKILKTKQLVRPQVFNMDESGLIYREMPKRTFVGANETEAAGFKGQKDRLTVAFCCNADGSLKLPLMVVGKSKKPRWFKEYNPSSLPVSYKNQANAWVDSVIFETWFLTEFVPEVTKFLTMKNLPLRALLLVDNCRSHKFLKCGEIEVAFLPPNVTSLIQPLDQGIIEMAKRYYRFLLSSSLLAAQEEGLSVIEQLKTVNPGRGIQWIHEAWTTVPPATIYKCWKKLWPVETQEASTQTDDQDSSSVLSLLDSAAGCESVEAALTREGRITDTDLLSVLHQIDEYKFVTEENLSAWVENNDYMYQEPLSHAEIIDQVRSSNWSLGVMNDTMKDATGLLDKRVSPQVSGKGADTTFKGLQPIQNACCSTEVLQSSESEINHDYEEEYVFSDPYLTDAFQVLYGP